MSGIPLEFQPWLQPGHIPDSLWNYQAPTLNEWEIDRNWDWAEKDASEYLTDEQKAAKAAKAVQQQMKEGGQDNQENPWAGYENVQDAINFANQAANIQATQNALELASQGMLDIDVAQQTGHHGVPASMDHPDHPD